MALLAIMAMAACDGSIQRTDYHSVGGAWPRDSIVEFTFSGLDTVAPHDIFINLRNDQTYPYSNLFLIAELRFPAGDVVTDTLEYEMARPNGEWLGKGRGGIMENKLWYKENIIFPTSGVYTLRISQAMRKNGKVNGIESLEGVTDVGYEITKSN